MDYSREAQFGRKYGWFNSIYALANGDVSKFETVTKQNIFTALTWLEFEKEKTEIERSKYK